MKPSQAIEARGLLCDNCESPIAKCEECGVPFGMEELICCDKSIAHFCLVCGEKIEKERKENIDVEEEQGR